MGRNTTIIILTVALLFTHIATFFIGRNVGINRCNSKVEVINNDSASYTKPTLYRVYRDTCLTRKPTIKRVGNVRGIAKTPCDTITVNDVVYEIDTIFFVKDSGYVALYEYNEPGINIKESITVSGTNTTIHSIDRSITIDEAHFTKVIKVPVVTTITPTRKNKIIVGGFTGLDFEKVDDIRILYGLNLGFESKRGYTIMGGLTQNKIATLGINFPIINF